jgi:hypothetical protein
MKNFRIHAIALVALVTFSSCSDDDTAVVPVNEEEVITTVTATFRPTGGGDIVTLTSRDLDGDGPQAPANTVSGPFATGKTYNGTVMFLNELSSPVDNITEEVREEGEEHQLFFQQTGLGRFNYSDADANDNPIGLSFQYIATSTPATGNLTITLRHLPNKDAANVVTGDITNAGGGTDAQVIFPVAVR